MPNVMFTPIKIGSLELPHRIAMAPLTRSRASKSGNIPTAMNVEYYRQRASAALIITEAAQISSRGQGCAWTPGIYSPEQIAGWKKVSRAVHEEVGRIFMQLWHVGRVSHPSFQPGDALPVGPSALPIPGKTFIVDDQDEGVWADVPTPRALSVADIDGIVGDHVKASRNAVEAGMDGVEIHAGTAICLISLSTATATSGSTNMAVRVKIVLAFCFVWLRRSRERLARDVSLFDCRRWAVSWGWATIHPSRRSA